MVVTDDSENDKVNETTNDSKPNKSLIFKLFLVLSLIVVLPSLFVLINSAKDEQDIRSQAASKNPPIAQKIIFMKFKFDKDNQGDALLTFDKPEVRKGFLASDQTSGKILYTTTILDKNFQPLSSQRFFLQGYVAIDGIDMVSGQTHGELKEVISNETAIGLPYNDSAAYIKTENIKGETISVLSLENASKINNIVAPKPKDESDYKEKIKKKKIEKEDLNIKSILNRTSKSIQDSVKKQEGSNVIKDNIKQNLEKKGSDNLGGTKDGVGSNVEKKGSGSLEGVRSGAGSKATEQNNNSIKSKIDNIINSVFKIKRSNLNTPFISEVFAANGRFNLAIIGDNYNGDFIKFQSDVDDLAQALFTVEPFAKHSKKIVLYPQLSTTAICRDAVGWPSISCDDSVALQQASTVPYDKVYILYNGNYTGYSYIEGVLSYGSNSLDQNLAVKQGLFLHEMAGHSLGGLMDEYSYGVTGLSYAPNCTESNNCPSWSTITGLGCFSTCGYTNLYRATDNSSVMNTSYFRGQLDFDSFSTQIIEGKLSEYLMIINPAVITPSITQIPSPTITTTITLTLTPSMSPTPSPSITPSPTVTITLTPTPVPTITELPRIYIETTLLTESSSTPVPTITPTQTATPTLTSTPTLTLTPTPTLTITPSITLTVTPTVTLVVTDSTSVINCSVPNYCTAAKYCMEDLRTDGNCAGSERVCCKPKTKFEEKKTDIFNIQGNLPTPTSIQRFIPLPTVPLPTPTVEKLILPTYPANKMYVEATVTRIPSITQTPSGLVVNTPSPTAYYLTSQNLQPTRVIPTQIRITDVWPTEELLPTSTDVADLDFERATPTPIPQPSAGNILQTSFSFIATLFKTVLSLLIGQ